VSGEEHVETTLVRSNLALLREQQDRLEESEELQRDAIDRFRRTVGPDHIHTINATVHCAHAMRRRGLATEAAAMLAEIRQALEAKVAPDSLSMATFRLRLGQALLDLGRYPEARAELEIATKRILGAPSTSPAGRQECERVMATLVEREAASASPAGGP
jgi:tetratricopeptide (TPR) repeat protein